LLFLISFNGVAQEFADKEYYLVDSLVLDELTKRDKQLLETSLKKYHSVKDDTNKINALNDICENMMHEDWEKYQFYQYELIKQTLKTINTKSLKNSLADALNNIGFIYHHQGKNNEALDFYNRSLKIQEEIGNKKGMASSLNNIGAIYKRKGDAKEALNCYNKSYKIREEIGDKKGIASSLSHMGNIFKTQGQIKQALNYYDRSLSIYEEIGNKKGIAESLGVIANIFSGQGQVGDALNYYNRSLKIQEEIGNKKGIGVCLVNIGLLYTRQGQSKKAINYYKRSLKIQEEIGDKRGIAESLNNIGALHKKQGELNKALNYARRSLELHKEIGNKKGVANSLNNIGAIYTKQEQHNDALNYANKSLKISQQICTPYYIRNAAILLCEIYEKQGKGIKALEMYKLHVQMKDSINNEATQKASIRQQTKYEFEKVQAVKDKEHEKQLEVEQEAKAKQQVITYAAAGGLGLVGIFLFFVMNRLKVTRKQKTVIEEQKEIVEEAHQEIQDSIAYAKRIQSAILPPIKLVKEYLKESFILYKPKDVVAGDFYWLEHKDNKILFAAADCTGHGVPGAMVSVVCNNALNRSVREHGLTDVGAILDKTREIVIAEFEKSEEDVKDGMDIALCSLEGNKLLYAGAHNPLWTIRNGEIIETKANKQPIGQFDNPEPYTTHSFELESGDSLYIFSDGYVDQFGGEKGKKFKARAFRELLLSIQDKSMEAQKIIIDESFEAWRDDLEQVDDVCVIGVKV